MEQSRSHLRASSGSLGRQGVVQEKSEDATHCRVRDQRCFMQPTMSVLVYDVWVQYPFEVASRKVRYRSWLLTMKHVAGVKLMTSSRPSPKTKPLPRTLARKFSRNSMKRVSDAVPLTYTIIPERRLTWTEANQFEGITI